MTHFNRIIVNISLLLSTAY